ncbi:hypothetical protein JKP88DRAFT_263615 [Tribonema minus]|uniref:histone deacetylase n=1 Tax=Tribonema minus TaxID=303371 RepID=A0A835YWT3_9STRA|nr:hypothetical protein JKP88DRAFT_263615 [Tribonema minus]
MSQLIRPIKTIALARNPQRRKLWPARICDQQEVQEWISEKGPPHSKGLVLVVYLCDEGHHVVAWVLPTDLTPYRAHRTQDARLAEEWAAALRERQRAAEANTGGGNIGVRLGEFENAGKMAMNYYIHELNVKAHAFFEDELESPWSCANCEEYTLTCRCKEGLPAFIAARHAKFGDEYQDLDCAEPDCPHCKPPGTLMYAAQWQGGGEKAARKRRDHAAAASDGDDDDNVISGPKKVVGNRAETIAKRQRIMSGSGGGGGGASGGGGGGGSSAALTNGAAAASAAAAAAAAATAAAAAALAAAGGSKRDKKRTKRCGTCAGCTAPPCGQCINCKDSKSRMREYLVDGSRAMALAAAVVTGHRDVVWGDRGLMIAPGLAYEIMAIDPFDHMTQALDSIERAHEMTLEACAQGGDRLGGGGGGKGRRERRRSSPLYPPPQPRAAVKTSSFTGVSRFYPKRGDTVPMFKARIKCPQHLPGRGGKDVTLGIFNDEIDAAVAYDKALRNWFPNRLKKMNFQSEEAVAHARAALAAGAAQESAGGRARVPSANAAFKGEEDGGDERSSSDDSDAGGEGREAFAASDEAGDADDEDFSDTELQTDERNRASPSDAMMIIVGWYGGPVRGSEGAVRYMCKEDVGDNELQTDEPDRASPSDAMRAPAPAAAAAAAAPPRPRSDSVDSSRTNGSRSSLASSHVTGAAAATTAAKSQSAAADRADGSTAQQGKPPLFPADRGGAAVGGGGGGGGSSVDPQRLPGHELMQEVCRPDSKKGRADLTGVVTDLLRQQFREAIKEALFAGRSAAPAAAAAAALAGTDGGGGAGADDSAEVDRDGLICKLRYSCCVLQLHHALQAAWAAHTAAEAYFGYQESLCPTLTPSSSGGGASSIAPMDVVSAAEDQSASFALAAPENTPLPSSGRAQQIERMRAQWRQLLCLLTRRNTPPFAPAESATAAAAAAGIAVSPSAANGSGGSFGGFGGFACGRRALLLGARVCATHRVMRGQMEVPGRMREALNALDWTHKVLPEVTDLDTEVHPRYKALTTPHRLLRLGHDAGYLARIRHRCASATAAEDLHGTAHLSSCPLSSSEDGDSDAGAANENDPQGEGGGGGGGAQVTRASSEGRRGGGGRKHPDTVGCTSSWDAAITAVAAVVQGVDAVLSGSDGVRYAFCAVRPPGHHAGADLHAMNVGSNGFCILNSAALGAMYAHYHKGLRRVCVVDIDVHHGNGTQDLLARTHNPLLFYASVHAHSVGDAKDGAGAVFPRTGGPNDKYGTGNVLNIPIAPPIQPADFHSAVAEMVQALRRFKPDLIVISAGFDAHLTDPNELGLLQAADFYDATKVLAGAAEELCGGRLISVLEGGYAVERSTLFGGRNNRGFMGTVHSETLSDSVQAHTQALAEAAMGFF